MLRTERRGDKEYLVHELGFSFLAPPPEYVRDPRIEEMIRLQLAGKVKRFDAFAFHNEKQRSMPLWGSTPTQRVEQLVERERRPEAILADSAALST